MTTRTLAVKQSCVILAAEKTVLLAKPMNGINAPQRPDCVADDAVSCELVSTPNSLLYLDSTKTREAVG